MFNYEFVSLSKEQIETRRKLLDHAGYHAYLTPILILSAIYIFRKTKATTDSLHKHESAPSSLALTLRRISWTLGDTYIGEFGPLQVQVFGLLYAAFLLFRITYQTGNDYMHVTKAFGHVAVSQLPFHYLLAIKSPYSPITVATGLTHERLNSYHRLFGRIVHALLATHAVLYLRFFVKIDALSKRIKDMDVRLGVMAFWTMNFIGILSLPPVRAKVYHQVFYRSHVILSVLLLVILWFHVPYTRIYVAQAAIVWVLNGVLRTGASQPAKVTCSAKSENIFQITIKTTGKHLHPYLPGVHVYLKKSGLGPRTPFTVLSARGLDQGVSQIELVAKNSGGPMTGWLANMSKTDQTLDLQLEGPYGEAQRYMPQLLTDQSKKQQKVLLVAGGVGATYALPIFKALAESRGSVDNLKLVWAVHTVEDVAWAKAFLENPLLLPSFEINITKPPASGPDFLEKAKTDGLTVIEKRPHLDAVVDSFLTLTLDSNASEKSGRSMMKRDTSPAVVMVCGPSGLSSSLRKSIGRHSYVYGRDITWWEEQFGFGASLS